MARPASRASPSQIATFGAFWGRSLIDATGGPSWRCRLIRANRASPSGHSTWQDLRKPTLGFPRQPFITANLSGALLFRLYEITSFTGAYGGSTEISIT